MLYEKPQLQTAGIWRVGFIKDKYNIADSLTKILSATIKEKLVRRQEWAVLVNGGLMDLDGRR